MYKVVLIDDESIIVEGLQRVVDWTGHNCEVVAAGCDAHSGAEAIRTHRPNIVFTDINMPTVDGLTILAGLKGEFPQKQITVLTGYRDFDYARRAIELGVARFLLKPSKMDELDKLPAPPPGAAENANSFLARQAQGYIADHYAEKLTLLEVADHCYVSQWHLSKLLHKHLSLNFYDILNGVRIQKAKELLEDPALRISEIAERVGYADTAHFSRVFKKSESISANEYRNRRCGGIPLN